ncbi:hypothetical protein BJX64DRAFT_150083 [Aspergillus heterothallicus]
MDVLSVSANQLVDRAQRFSAITGLVRSNPEDRFFLVMGKTGSGKSTFIARCTGQDVTVSHGLYSCTSVIDTYSYSLPLAKPYGWARTRRIHLIDTPGFNDTNRSDIETLEILASYLGASYANGVRINGIIFLHPITDNRVSGSSMRTMEMLKMICGWTSYKSMAITSTMWPDRSKSTFNYTSCESELGVDSHSLLEQREAELMTDQRFLGEVVAKGAVVFRHNESGSKDVNPQTLSARRIVARLIAESDSPTYQLEPLRLQREIIDEGKRLGELVSGIAIADDINKSQRDHERQLRELETELRSQHIKADLRHTTELQDLKTEILDKIAKEEEEKRALQKTMGVLHQKERETWVNQIQELDKQFKEKILEREKDLQELKESIHQIQQHMSLSQGSSNDEANFDAHQQIVNSTGEEIAHAKRTRDRLKEVGSIVLKGLASGAGGAITTSVIGAVAGTLLCIVM